MKIELKVTGMSCNHCISLVNKAIKKLQADAKVTVDLASQQVQVESSLAVEDLMTALDEAGFPATVND
ncbi:MAG: heavy-metal-associated domain-containing protein [Gammaproteobacteria bacterium]|nr:heavy-metal-associated domain-containing protein [Gammaproteobacteria bacterium]MBU2059963.1 heavy-metal-associated domain-containing protein [Gammaproteobacteria bacterium]MBU2175782.1 heavy-metal-associated domain-containing protein [Gammaproteobacteria bacterium]MBU2247605.1 heavy-metal-associated domain-containing protein [Gammaproteobacteria bacterium]MBU2342920.1 heavy-metal-associated domain-containing protein [Gammaproteobacteria bacterium]